MDASLTEDELKLLGGINKWWWKDKSRNSKLNEEKLLTKVSRLSRKQSSPAATGRYFEKALNNIYCQLFVEISSAIQHRIDFKNPQKIRSQLSTKWFLKWNLHVSENREKIQYETKKCKKTKSLVLKTHASSLYSRLSLCFTSIDRK